MYRPVEGVSRHPIMFINVDFPEPEGPIKATYSPLFTEIVTDLSASITSWSPALVERPDLLQRPIIERGDRAVLGRPPENVLELLD